MALEKIATDSAESAYNPIVVNPPERKLTKRTSVQWSNLHELQIFNV